MIIVGEHAKETAMAVVREAVKVVAVIALVNAMEPVKVIVIRPARIVYVDFLYNTYILWKITTKICYQEENSSRKQQKEYCPS
ncbi:MAG: hypothetical protein ACI3YG_03085 [Prevotella sp.]